ncbi:hypothetical protein BX600DRAFT_506279 [Xylariales sp. PMI_506]|nr:hypothetical protein BX600DRAFT_506279 [Xylariales sp. PMI_506]
MGSEKIVLVTGANTGIGYQIVRALFESPGAYTVLVSGRSLFKAEQAVSNLVGEFPDSRSSAHVIQIDVESDESIEAAFQQVKERFGKLDWLVNNAGALFDPLLSSGKMTLRQVWNQSWNVNTAGTQVLTSAFIPLLLESTDPRLLFITSGTSTLAGTENRSLPMNQVPVKGWPKTVLTTSNYSAYRSSKAGLNMMMREWHRILKEDGVKVHAISPGYLATGLGGSIENNKKNGAGDPTVAGGLVREVLEGRRDDDAGKVVMRGGIIQPW